MKTQDNFSIWGRFRSIGYALEGLWLMLKTEHNAWVHLTATICTTIAGFSFKIAQEEWIFVIMAIVAVWVAEAMNTAFELLCDVTSPEFHPLVKMAKDVSAGAVLISAVGALVVGSIVFIPYIVKCSL